MCMNKADKKLPNVKDIVKQACNNHIVIPAFNIAYIPMVKPVVEALKSNETFGLIEVARADVEKFGAKGYKEVIEEYHKYFDYRYMRLHLDHTPVIDEDGKKVDWEFLIRQAIELGYDSVMIDGSRLSFKENIEITKKVVELAHKKEIAVESELGAVFGHEKGPLPDYEELFKSGKGFTNLEQAKEFVEQTGVDWLSVAIGNIHGALGSISKTKEKIKARLNIEHLQKLKEVTKIPLVLHGGSGIQQSYVLEAVKNGIAKINVGTEIRRAYEQIIIQNPEDITLAQDKVKETMNQLINGYYFIKGSAKKIFTFLFMLGSVLFSVGAGDLTAWHQSSGTFPVTFWWPPPPPLHASTTRHAEIAECNFTLWLGGNRVDTYEENISVLNLAQTNGFKCIVLDSRLTGSDYTSTTTIQQVVNDYKDHPAFYGYYLTDEPHVSKFPLWAYKVKKLKERDPEHLAYINLYPNYADPATQLGTPDYETYVSSFMDNVKPEMLSYDHYGFAYGWGDDSHLQNMETVRKYGLIHSVPFWYIGYSIDYMPDGNNIPLPNGMNKYVMGYQAYTSLVYGGKSYSHYVYWPYLNCGNAILGNTTTTYATYVYYLAKEVNKEIQFLGQILINTTSQAVYQVDATPPAGTTKFTDNTDPVVKYVTPDSNIVAGTFKDGQGRDLAMFVNRNNADVNVTIRLKANQSVEKISKVDGTMEYCFHNTFR